MFVEVVHKLVHRGARWPLSFWPDEYERLKERLLEEIPLVESTQLDSLAQLVSQPSLREAELADQFHQLVPFIGEEGSFYLQAFGCAGLKEDTRQFLTLARLTEIFEKKRSNLKRSLSLQQQREEDVRLFAEYEGNMYCLEYYLMIYKLLRDTHDPKRQRYFFEEKEVDTGEAEIPGLWTDLSDLSVLEKFIYRIFDEEIRRDAAEAYFSFRSKAMDIRPSWNHPYGSYSIEEILFEMKLFLKRLIDLYIRLGIPELESYFFTSFGKHLVLSQIPL